MDGEPNKGGFPVLFVAHVVCCGAIILIATGALSGVSAWLLEGGLSWVLLAGALGVLGGFLLRRWARPAETSGESRQSQARTSVRGAPTQPSAVWTRPAGEPPKVNQR